MGGFIDFGVDLIKGGMETYGVTTNPVFMPGNVEPRYTEFLSFVGVSVDHDTNTNYYMDATVAYRRACLNAIEYLKKFGYSGEQAYLLLSCCPCEGRISGIVDIPNACCTLAMARNAPRAARERALPTLTRFTPIAASSATVAQSPSSSS